MKYVIIKSGNLETPYLFPETETHGDVARALTRGNPDSVVSAGFCDIYCDSDKCEYTWSCWGESVSLGVKSLPTDAATLNRMFETNPY